MRQRIGHFLGGMTFFAVHRDVFALQFVFGFVVVKFVQISRFPETVFVVTFGAIGPEITFVHIFVAGNAVIGFYAQSVLKNQQGRDVHFVTFPAIDLFVFAFQGEWRAAVVKLVQTRLRGKRLVVVALFAIVAQVFVVGIFMAIVAICIGYTRKLLKFSAITGFFFMTIDTGNCFVFAL